MKIALLLTGQLRTFKMCGHLVKNMILDHYDVDVFMSINKSNKLQTTNLYNTKYTENEDIQEALNFYKPITYFINENYDKEFCKLVIDPVIIENMPEMIIKLCLEQYFIVKKAYELLINHIKKTDQKYDAVIRLRYDQFIWDDNNISHLLSVQKGQKNNILYNEFNTNILIREKSKLKIDIPLENNVYVFGFGDFTNYKYVNDQFWIHSNDLIDTFYKFYDEILDITLECTQNIFPKNGCYFEHCLYQFLIRHKIQYHKSQAHGDFVREIN